MKKLFSVAFLAAMSIVYWVTERAERRKQQPKTVTQRLLSWHAGQVHKHVQQR